MLDTWKPRNPGRSRVRERLLAVDRERPDAGEQRPDPADHAIGSGRGDVEVPRVARPEVDDPAVGRDDRVVRARPGVDLAAHVPRSRVDDVPNVVVRSLACRQVERAAVRRDRGAVRARRKGALPENPVAEQVVREQRTVAAGPSVAADAEIERPRRRVTRRRPGGRVPRVPTSARPVDDRARCRRRRSAGRGRHTRIGGTRQLRARHRCGKPGGRHAGSARVSARTARAGRRGAHHNPTATLQARPPQPAPSPDPS